MFRNEKSTVITTDCGKDLHSGGDDIETGFTGPQLRGGASGGEVAGVACMMLCLSVLILGLAVPVLYFAFEDENSTCQKGTRGGLTLSDWLKGAGFSDVCLLFCIWVIMLMAATCEMEPAGPAIVLTVIALVFKVMWWIWGVVILATAENNHCVAEGKGMAVMAIIWLVLSWGSLGASGGGSRGGD